MKKGPLLKILFISVLYFICIIFVFRLPLMGLGRILYTPIFNLGYDSSNWDFILKTNLGIFPPRITIFLMKYFSNLASLRILAFLVHGINTLLFLLILQQFNIKKYLASASIFYLFFPLHLWQCISPEYLPLLICGLLALSSFALYAEYLRKQKNYFLLLSFLVFFVCLSLSKIFFFLPFVFIFLSFYPQYFSKNNLVKSSLKLNIIKLLPFIFVIFSQWPLLNFDISNRSNDWTFYMEDIEHSKLLQLYYHLNTDKTSSLSNELKLFLSNNKLHHSSLNKISLNFYKHFQYFEFFQFIEAKNFKEKLGLLPSVKLFYLCSIIYLMGILFLPFVISLLQKYHPPKK